MLLIVLVGVLAAGALVTKLVWPRLEMWAAGYHQRQVTRALAEWSRAYSSVSSREEAIDAVGMVDYIAHFYVPGPGYRGSPEIESALAKQRQESILQIVAALENFSGLHYGTNTERWKQWADTQKLGLSWGSEPDGAANGSQPIRSETNSTSSAAGSRR
jgi:hypothetical protein